jgi:twitching motility protein PilU
VDTFSYENALKNAMREAPDVLMIGEIRDAETMTHAINYAQSGHLCMSTLHANNSYHMLNRVISLFPTESRNALLMDLSVSCAPLSRSGWCPPRMASRFRHWKS